MVLFRKADFMESISEIAKSTDTDAMIRAARLAAAQISP
jgi:hypothetical protein